MDAFEAIKQRHSTRRFADRKVARDAVEGVVDAARRAPTAMNVQPWEFVAVTDTAMRKRIADATDYGKFVAEAPVCVAVFCKEGKFYLEDGCAATENLLVAAQASGLGSCWVAGDKKRYARQIGEMLGVPEQYKLVSLIALGYEKIASAPRKKRPLKEVLHWERF